MRPVVLPLKIMYYDFVEGIKEIKDRIKKQLELENYRALVGNNSKKMTGHKQYIVCISATR